MIMMIHWWFFENCLEIDLLEMEVVINVVEQKFDNIWKRFLLSSKNES